ncbi:hypothetical protein E0Z10_g3439 [Xylaria hypoxylon]|uniref:Uncharacterized protein n=1 Tax=Xylaria hypoxylon TaxID=37992 RepID=A0A4Z0Z3H5_9PEZI|nr:hypothetical protein E0Z10_g3439 [Xylaria hypoxylon]
MEFLRKSKTCIFVECPLHRNLPEPQRCYPGFRAALIDICDRFGDFYAPFAGYNAHTRVISLYAMGTPRPEHKFIDEDTAIFDLGKARSAWVRSTSTYASSTDATKGTSRDISEDLTEVSDHSQAESDETSTVLVVGDGNDEDDAIDEDMASRLNFMG